MGRAGIHLDWVCRHLAIDGMCGDSANGRVYRLPRHGRPRRHEADGDTGKAGMDIDDHAQDISGEGASLKSADTKADEADEASIIGQPTVRTHTLALHQPRWGMRGLGNRWGVRGLVSMGYAGTWQSMGHAGMGPVYRLPCHGRPRRHEADGDTGGTDDFERQVQDISGDGASVKGADTAAEEAGGQPTALGIFASGCRWDVQGFGSMGCAGTWLSMGCAGIRLWVVFIVCFATAGPDAARPLATRPPRA